MNSLLKIVQGLPDYELLQYPSGIVYRGNFQLDMGYSGMVILGNVFHQHSLISSSIPAIEWGNYLFFVLSESEEILILQDEIGSRMKPGEYMPQGWEIFSDIAVVFDRKGWSAMVCLYLPHELADLKLKNPDFVKEVNNQINRKFRHYFTC